MQSTGPSISSYDFQTDNDRHLTYHVMTATRSDVNTTAYLVTIIVWVIIWLATEKKPGCCKHAGLLEFS